MKNICYSISFYYDDNGMEFSELIERCCLAIISNRIDIYE